MQSDVSNFALPFNWPSMPFCRGKTLLEISKQKGGIEQLIAMADWKKITVLYPGAKEKIEEFLRLPEVRQAATLARYEMSQTRSRRLPAQIHAQREKQAEFGY